MIGPAATTIVRSLPAIVGDTAERDPERLAFRALDHDGREFERITLGGLETAYRRLATQLRKVAGPGDRVLVPSLPGVQFQIAFLACLCAELVAVPVPAIRAVRTSARTPQGRWSRLMGVCRDCTPAVAIVAANQVEPLRNQVNSIAELRSLRFLSVQPQAQLDNDDELLPVPAAVDLAEPAFLQYTSGSTGQPRGVVISHGAMLANLAMISAQLNPGPGTEGVTWLPPYHDMGLTCNVLLPVFAGIATTLLEPETFLLRPDLWLRELSGRTDVATAAPDFAYRHAIARVRGDARRALDLSGWRIALTGAEPVRADTLRDFAEAFGAWGFRPGTFVPAYGLAEATLFVTGTAGEGPPTVLRCDPTVLRSGEARPTDAPDATLIVGLGRPGDGVELQIVDRDAVPRPPLHIGEIWVSSPSTGSGYWAQPALSQATFGEGWLRTGDLGFLDAAGQLFVTGRLKEILIIRGANYIPQDFEMLVQQAHPLLSGGAAAAFPDAAAPDRVIVVVEVDRLTPAHELPGALAAAVRATAESLAVQVEVVAIPGALIPRTTSGKVRRLDCAARYAAGELRHLASSTDQT